MLGMFATFSQNDHYVNIRSTHHFMHVGKTGNGKNSRNFLRLFGYQITYSNQLCVVNLVEAEQL